MENDAGAVAGANSGDSLKKKRKKYLKNFRKKPEAIQEEVVLNFLLQYRHFRKSYFYKLQPKTVKFKKIPKRKRKNKKILSQVVTFCQVLQ